MKHILATAALLAASVMGANAQNYPTRPVSLIVPFAAGGPTDTIARIIGESLGKTLGQQIIVENVAGAGGTTGSTRAFQAPADGYTMLVGHMGTHGAAPALYPALKYKPAQDFTPIGFVAGTPILVVTKLGFPAKTLKEFVAYAKTNGDKVTEAHAGVGSVSHTTCTLLASVAGIKTGRIAYRGTGPALNDLVAGQVDFGCDQIVNLVSQVQGGKVQALAIATKERSPVLPNVPTSAEAGLPEYEVSAWNALFAPKGLPKPIHDKLVAALDTALDDEGVRKRLLELGSVLPDKAGRSPQALQALVEKEVARWGSVLKGIQAN